ncbi:chlorophyll synthase, chloroplastic [Trifolium repens]|nr:chlorophyll synthase, chloroplastic [Trifolium repens]
MLADSYMINSLEEEVRTLRLSNKPDRLTASVLNLHLTLWRPPFYWSSTAQLGIAIVNDFKSVEGDRALGLQSLPVAFGSETAKWICVGAIDITQLSVAGYLLGAGKPYYALALLALIAPQVFFQFKYFLKDPVKYDVKLISGI